MHSWPLQQQRRRGIKTQGAHWGATGATGGAKDHSTLPDEAYPPLSKGGCPVGSKWEAPEWVAPALTQSSFPARHPAESTRKSCEHVNRSAAHLIIDAVQRSAACLCVAHAAPTRAATSPWAISTSLASICMCIQDTYPLTLAALSALQTEVLHRNGQPTNMVCDCSRSSHSHFDTLDLLSYAYYQSRSWMQPFLDP